MYHCHLRFYLMGRDRGLLDAVRGAPPLERFTHAFTESEHPDAVLCAGADVLLLDLRGTDGPAALDALLPAGKEGAEVLAVASRAQLPGLAPYLPRLREYVSGINPFDSDAEYVHLSTLRRHTVSLGVALHFITDFLEHI